MQFLNQFAGWGGQALALALGAVFLVHGLAKLKNPAAMAGFWWGSTALALLHGSVEVAAAVLVILGPGAEWGALAMAVIMLGAIYEKIFKWKTPFSGRETTGWEFDLVLLAGALAILLG